MALVACLMIAPAFAKDVTVTVTNEEKVQRQEVVEIDLYAVYKSLGINVGEPIVVKNALGQEVAYQISYDGKILVDVSVRPCGNAAFTVSAGNPRAMKTFVTGRMYPERVDDIAWENDRTAYRIYGPALQKSGERAFGVDVWVKNTPDLEVEKRYVTELSNHHKIEALKKARKNDEALAMEESTTYHFDHGYGLDCYKVGPSLGGGAPALMSGDQLILPYCYKDYKILDNGPLRFTVQVSYHPTAINGDENVVENRIISLDKGSNFNKCTVWYDGLTKKTDLAMGVVLHQEDIESMVLGDDMVLYADPTDNPVAQNFQIYVGVLFPNGVKTTKALMNKQVLNGIAGHAVGITSCQAGEKYTYYFGSAWSKNDVRTMNEWKLRAEETLNALHTPMTVNIQ
ncbi:MAG: DUF4861 domain-containing protein [Prevotella sp.]|nr:DUF4861 domain-containing protein [Prevotella sp.]